MMLFLRTASVAGLLLGCLVVSIPTMAYAGPLAGVTRSTATTLSVRSGGYRHPVSDSESDQQQLAVWNAIKDTGNTALLEAFLETYPESIYGDLVRASLARLQTGGETTASASSASSTQNVTNDTGINAFDGTWSITATHLYGPYGRIPFCRSRETMKTTFTVSYGEIDHQARTNKGAPVNIEGEFSQSGKLVLEVIPWGPNESGGWGGNVKRGQLQIKENMRGKALVRTIAGEDCKVELVLTRE